MARFLFLNTFVFLYSLFYSLLAILISFFDKEGTKVHIYVAVPWARGILRVCGIRVRVRGQEKVNAHIPRIYMTNHQSYFDIFGLLAYLPVNFKFIVKEELMHIPFLGRAMRGAGYIGIERDDPRKAVHSMRSAAEKIKNGASVVIFIEGTRSVDGKLQAFKRGGFNLALKSGCDIVTVAISNSYRIVPKGSLKINKGSFDIEIGEPISLQGYRKRDIARVMDRMREAMLDQMTQNGAGQREWK